MLTRLTIPAPLWHDVPSQVAQVDGEVVVSLRDGSTSTLLGAVASQFERPVGVWLEVNSKYPASIAARDVKTLAQLCHVDSVVVASEDERAAQHAQIVEALLSGERVTLENQVADLDGAYSRPAPPHPITVWWREGEHLRSHERTLVLLRQSNTTDVDVEVYQ